MAVQQPSAECTSTSCGIVSYSHCKESFMALLIKCLLVTNPVECERAEVRFVLSSPNLDALNVDFDSTHG